MKGWASIEQIWSSVSARWLKQIDVLEEEL